jgi:uroporphyrinogen III methyltransferase/synthase
MGRGKVYLVGAGPGDPGLLTTRGRELLRTADVVYHDGLIGPELLRRIPRGVRKVRVAKGRRPRDNVPQSRINELLVAEAKAGRRVVRLKGGDPFLLSRGGEEAEALRANGIPFEVVPGVSSALAAPAFAGIPLTDRRWASSVAIVTGHESRSAARGTVDWAGLARSADTLVILMGVAMLPKIARTLLDAGLSRDTPVAAIRWATTPRQRTVLFTLGEALRKGVRERLRSPSVLVVGPTSAQACRLCWNPRETRWASPGFLRAATQGNRPAPRREGPERPSDR